MISSVDAPALPNSSASTEAMRVELAKNDAQMQNILALKLDATNSVNQKMTRRQLETMLMHAERSLANEASSRALSQMFGRFALLQKLMQSMN
jgi:hypothetical protein